MMVLCKWEIGLWPMGVYLVRLIFNVIGLRLQRFDL